jgi:hypothetical protein
MVWPQANDAEKQTAKYVYVFGTAIFS